MTREAAFQLISRSVEGRAIGFDAFPEWFEE